MTRSVNMLWPEPSPKSIMLHCTRRLGVAPIGIEKSGDLAFSIVTLISKKRTRLERGTTQCGVPELQ